MNINYVDKLELEDGQFGVCIGFGDNAIIKIRRDLPYSMKNFILAHELYHTTDKAKWWVWREIKANWAGCKQYPYGCLQTIIKSLSLNRLKYYFNRIKKGK
jgi:hypothetical protein